MRQPVSIRGRLFSSLHIVDFRRLWFFDLFAAAGNSMDQLAQGWLVLTITDSPFWVGAVLGIRGIGQICFSPLGGVIADRFNRVRILQVSHILRIAMLVALGFLIYSDQIELWHCIVLAVFQGLLQAGVTPSTKSLAFDMVGSKRLMNALAALHGASDIARLVGSILVGFLITFAGMGVAYFVISAFFAASLIPLSFVRAKPAAQKIGQSFFANLKAGVQYAGGHKTIRRVLLFTVLIEAFGFGHQVMLPVIARDYLEVGATGLGFLNAAAGLGGILGIVLLGAAGDVRAKGVLLLGLGVGVGVSVILFGLSDWFALSLVLSGVLRAGLVTYDSTLNATLILLAVDSLRGRILGLVSVAYGFTSVSGFAYGVVASLYNAPLALVLGGGVIIVAWAGLMLPIQTLRKPAIFESDISGK